MDVSNVVEKLVWEHLDSVMAQKPDICRCTRCRADVVALALNHLKPRYAVSPMGHAITRAEIMDQAFLVNVLVAIAQGVEQVYKNPHHDEAPQK